MATIYNVEVVPHWANYSKEELEKILNQEMKKYCRNNGNTIQINVINKKNK